MAKGKKIKPKKPVTKNVTAATEDEGGIGSRPDDRNPPKKP